MCRCRKWSRTFRTLQDPLSPRRSDSSIDHQLHVRMIHRFHPCQRFGGCVDDIALLAPLRLDGDRDVSSLASAPARLPKSTNCPTGLLPGKSLGHLTSPAAPEYDHPHTQTGCPVERLAKVLHLAALVDIGSGYLEPRREETNMRPAPEALAASAWRPVVRSPHRRAPRPPRCEPPCNRTPRTSQRRCPLTVRSSRSGPCGEAPGPTGTRPASGTAAVAVSGMVFFTAIRSTALPRVARCAAPACCCILRSSCPASWSNPPAGGCW